MRVPRFARCSALEEGVRALHEQLPQSTPGLLCHLLRMQHVPSWLSQEAKDALLKARQTMESPAAMQLEEAGERMAKSSGSFLRQHPL